MICIMSRQKDSIRTVFFSTHNVKEVKNMLFIGSVFYNEKDNKLFGVLFNNLPEDRSERISTVVVDAKDLENFLVDKKLNGFEIDQGMLLGISDDYCICSEEDYDFVKQFAKEDKIIRSNKEIDLIGMMKYLISNGGIILPDFYNTDEFTGEEYVFAENFRVSKSSINIFAPFLSHDMWDTMYLYDSENVIPREFYCGIPVGIELPKGITPIETIKIDQNDFVVCRCKLDIEYEPIYSSGLINYLAYSIAEKKHFISIIDSLLETIIIKKQSPKYPSKNQDRKRTRQKININVKHSFEDFNSFNAAYNHAINNINIPMNDEIKTISSFYRYLETFKSKNSKDLLNKCTAMKLSLKEKLLQDSLELLAIRCSLLNIMDGKTAETTFKYANGGDVIGSTTIRRVGWR